MIRERGTRGPAVGTPAAVKLVTIKDVAREAGVSAMTVSNALNGRGRVAEATVARIRTVVDRLGYRPSVAARRLRLSRQWTIGMVIVDEDPDFLNDPFTTAQVTGLTNYLTTHAYSLIIRGMRPSDFRTTRLFQDIEADGMVAVLSGTPSQRQAIVGELAKLGLPLVLLQEQRQPTEPDCAIIRQDDGDGGAQVARHLVERGARRIWMMMPHREWPAMMARKAAVETVLAGVAGTEFRAVDCGDESYDATYAVTTRALGEGRAPDAIIGGNDQMAIAAMRAAQDLGHRIPEDIQIAGFNAFNVWRYVDPVLTTVRSAAHAIGKQAGIMLIDRLKQGRFQAGEVVLPVTFQPGNSTLTID